MGFGVFILTRMYWEIVPSSLGFVFLLDSLPFGWTSWLRCDVHDVVRISRRAHDVITTDRPTPRSSFVSETFAAVRIPRQTYTRIYRARRRVPTGGLRERPGRFSHRFVASFLKFKLQSRDGMEKFLVFFLVFCSFLIDVRPTATSSCPAPRARRFQAITIANAGDIFCVLKRALARPARVWRGTGTRGQAGWTDVSAWSAWRWTKKKNNTKTATVISGFGTRVYGIWRTYDYGGRGIRCSP